MLSSRSSTSFGMLLIGAYALVVPPVSISAIGMRFHWLISSPSGFGQDFRIAEIAWIVFPFVRATGLNLFRTGTDLQA